MNGYIPVFVIGHNEIPTSLGQRASSLRTKNANNCYLYIVPPVTDRISRSKILAPGSSLCMRSTRASTGEVRLRQCDDQASVTFPLRERGHNHGILQVSNCRIPLDTHATTVEGCQFVPGIPHLTSSVPSPKTDHCGSFSWGGVGAIY